MKKTKADVKIYDVEKWHGFMGGVHLLKVEVGDFEEICEIAKLINRPLLYDKKKNRYKVLDGAVVYVYIGEE